MDYRTQESLVRTPLLIEAIDDPKREHPEGATGSARPTELNMSRKLTKRGQAHLSDILGHHIDSVKRHKESGAEGHPEPAWHRVHHRGHGEHIPAIHPRAAQALHARGVVDLAHKDHKSDDGDWRELPTHVRLSGPMLDMLRKRMG